jgi:prophage regulatory protein
MNLLRIDTAKQRAGYRSNTSIHKAIHAGLWTKPVSIGLRSVAWPDFEVDAICAARIAGASDDEIRNLVNKLHAKRADLMPTV